MVNFVLDEMQEMLKELAHEFARDEIRPYAEHWDLNSEYPKDTILAAHEMGLLEPFTYQKNTVVQVLVVWKKYWSMRNLHGETLVYSSICNCFSIRTNNYWSNRITKGKWLRKIAEEGALASYAVTEPEAGSDVAAIKTTAVRDGDEYVINGNKMWITGAGYADFFFVLAKLTQMQDTGGCLDSLLKEMQMESV